MVRIQTSIFRRFSDALAARLKFMACILVVGLSATVYASPPAQLDFIGGYYDESGEYTCYAQPCFSIHRGKNAAAAATRPFSIKEWAFKVRGCQEAFTESLEQTSKTPVVKETKEGCDFVVSGEWIDLYSASTVSDVSQLGFDQLVSYEEAHHYGGAYWGQKQRMAFINDAANIVPVSPELKKVRAGRSPSKWMPEDKSQWCDYIVRREIVQRKYKLVLPRVEREFQEEAIRLFCKY